MFFSVRDSSAAQRLLGAADGHGAGHAPQSMGTVVRMFVIPYDMRDMPALHRTFIRQRILAEELGKEEEENNGATTVPPQMPRSPTASSTTSKLGHFITAEQMKRLRYSIHLR